MADQSQSNSPKKASVGLVVTGHDDAGPAAIVQKRSPEDSYPLASQVTSHGKLNETELMKPGLSGFADALLREVREELGPEAARRVEENLARLELLKDVTTSDKRVLTFGMDMGDKLQEFLASIKPEPGVQFTTVRSTDTLEPLGPEHKKPGAAPTEFRMFADEIESIQLALGRMISAHLKPRDEQAATS